MTVSPNRPQDGNLQPTAGGSGVGPNDRSRPVETPPTLFKLPNLGATRTRGQATGPGQVSAGVPLPERAPVEVAPVDRAAADRATAATGPLDSSSPADTIPREPVDSGPVPFAPLNRADLDPSAVTQANPDHFNRAVSSTRGSAGSDHAALGSNPGTERAGNQADAWLATRASDSDRSSSSMRADEQSAASTREVPKRDVPAGRTWMDALGSHGVVIVLLLLVVAAALFTGNGEEDPAARSMSAQSELLSFDDLNVDLPLPTHGGSINLAETETTDAAEVDPVSSSDLTENLVGAPGIGAPTEPPAATSVSAADSAAPKSQPVTNTPAADPVASLEAPVATVTSGAAEQDDPVSSNSVQFNRFVASEGMVEAMTAGRRTESSQTDSSLPSLEELAGLREETPSSSESTPKSPVRVLSKTPVGVSDWSKYLPPLDSASEPEAGLPSSSNQVVQP